MRERYLKIWLGCDFLSWMKLLVRGGFALAPSHFPRAVMTTAISIFNTLLRYRQEIQYGARVKQTRIEQPPIFIIGHWRTGTTLLHEFLTQDDRHTYPTTYQCMSPNHFLVSEEPVNKYLHSILPSRRPMDSMRLDWSSPQEDEFALCNMGQPSPYLMFAFPEQARRFMPYFSLEALSPQERENWKSCLLRFFKHITFKTPKRIILKSPTHTFRIKILQELFPDALFIHIVRNPYVVFPSTVHMLESLSRIQSLQRPTFEGVEDFVLDTFNHMQEKFEDEKDSIAPSRFFELRYEDLVRDPIGRLSAIYEHFGLEDFERILPNIQNYLNSTKNYKTNRYELSPELHHKITERWGDYIRKYGYTE